MLNIKPNIWGFMSGGIYPTFDSLCFPSKIYAHWVPFTLKCCKPEATQPLVLSTVIVGRKGSQILSN